MEDILELYQEIILDHSKEPRKTEKLKIVTNSVSAKNPLCGDNVSLEVFIKDGKIEGISCNTSGCAISTAAGSIMAQEVSGMTVADAIKLCDKFISVVKDKEGMIEDPEELKLLCKVSDYPMRIKCALLPWSALKDVLNALPFSL